mmetsp:Transcript_32781/g.77709  ORF Transcript_32781/g.77709 Transcript_32781/m.77709 type:complete len:290 (+) Transcript_32781:1755-2624(+)
MLRLSTVLAGLTTPVPSPGRTLREKHFAKGTSTRSKNWRSASCEQSPASLSRRLSPSGAGAVPRTSYPCATWSAGACSPQAPRGCRRWATLERSAQKPLPEARPAPRPRSRGRPAACPSKWTGRRCGFPRPAGTAATTSPSCSSPPSAATPARGRPTCAGPSRSASAGAATRPAEASGTCGRSAAPPTPRSGPSSPGPAAGELRKTPPATSSRRAARRSPRRPSRHPSAPPDAPARWLPPRASPSRRSSSGGGPREPRREGVGDSGARVCGRARHRMTTPPFLPKSLTQ